MRTTTRWIAALALLAGTGLAACGDDDDTVETDPATQSEEDMPEDEMSEEEEMEDEEMEDEEMSEEEMSEDEG